MSSPPASPGFLPSGPGSAREGWASGAAEGGSRAGAAPASSPAAPPPSVARSDVSRLSADSHHSLHSIYSQRSRWSTAATLGGTSTVQRLAPEQPLEPAEPLPEEMSGASSTISGEGEAGELPRAAQRGRRQASAAGAGAARSTRGSSGGGGSALAATSPALAMQEAEDAAGNRTAAAAAAGPMDGHAAAADGRLPPRLIVFHPDGATFGIGVDKLREQELQRAAEAAAAQRRRQQQRAAAAAAGSGAAGDSAASAPGSREEGFDDNYPGWRQLYSRQKQILVGVLLLDVAYLVVLLVLHLVWGNSGAEPSLSGAEEFFVGSHPESTSISYLAGSLFTDLVALYGAVQNYASVVTLFIVWSVVLGAFAILEMPLLFIIIHLILLVAAFQLRFSMARLRNMLPPTSLGIFLSAAGRSMAASGIAAWTSATQRLHRRRQPPAPAPGTPAAAPVRGRTSSGSAAAGLPASPAAAASPVAAARSLALFRAALMRMMSEQRRTEFEQDLEMGASQRRAEPPPQLVIVDAGGVRPAGTLAAGSSRGAGRAPERRSSGAGSSAAAAAAATGAAGPGPGSGQEAAASDSLGRLYSRIMEDIAAVAAAPSSSSERRRQRRRERERSSRRLAAAPSAGAASDSGSRQRASAGPEAANGSSSDGGGDEERRAPGAAAGSSRRPRTSSSRLRRSEAAIAAAAVSGSQQRASATARPTTVAVSSGPPSWAELVALLNFHSEQEQLRRQRQVDVVPLVSLTAPPPAAEEGQEGPGSSGAQGGRDVL